MADVYMTSANVVTFNRIDLDILLSDVLDAAPVIQRLAARACASNNFVYTKKTANPAVGFRAVNNGIENTKGTYTQVTANLGVLDASFALDIAAATADERGVDHVMAVEAMAHMSQAMAEVEEQFFYGTGNDANGFAGLNSQTILSTAAGAMCVNAGGTTAATASSVWLIRTGEPDIQLLWGQNGVLSIGDRQIVERAGAVGRFPAYYHPIMGWVGCKFGTNYSAARICNLTADAGKGLTDALIAQAIMLFPAAAPPNLICMNRRSLQQLQKSRTATNPTGAPAPFPDSAFGVPIVVTDRILSTEALI